MSDKIQHFLLVFDHAQGKLVEEVHFGADGEQAVKAYSKKEHDYQGNRNVEIVLIGSDSIDTVRVTHANYYDGTVAISKYLAELEVG
jgi:hypothetical protein